MLLLNFLLLSLVLTNSLLILVSGEVRNQWLEIMSGWLGAQQGWELVAEKEMGLHEEGDITCRWGRGNDLQGGLPPGGDGDGHLTVLGEGNACSRGTISLQEGENGVEVITRRDSIGLRQELADILVGKDHGRPGFDCHSVGIAASIRVHGESG
jgi:hypothetical protein